MQQKLTRRLLKPLTLRDKPVGFVQALMSEAGQGLTATDVKRRQHESPYG